MHTSYVHKIPHHHQVVNTDARTRERVHEGPHARRRRTVSARSSSNALKKVLDFSSINSLSLLTHKHTLSHGCLLLLSFAPHETILLAFSKVGCANSAQRLFLSLRTLHASATGSGRKNIAARLAFFTDQFGCERQCRHHRLR